MKKLVTHHGKFHADDVFATAWLKKIYGDAEVIRIDRKDIDKYMNNDEYFVYDIGNGKYDHHIKECKERRPNGDLYASFGKIVRDIYQLAGLDKNTYLLFDKLIDLLSIGYFSRNELAEKLGSLQEADSLIHSYTKSNLLIPIKQNLYAVKDAKTGCSTLNAYEVACHITPSAYISNHSAFEYKGMQNQVFNEIYVSSETPFKSIEFDHKTIKCLPSSFSDGVEKEGRHVRVTNTERTLVDSIKNLNKIAGLEELLNNMLCIKSLNFDKLRIYLEKYKDPRIYQKTGFILAFFNNHLNVPKDFFFARKTVEKIYAT